MTTEHDGDHYACTLDPEGARARLPQAEALTGRLRARERTGDHLVLRFEPGDDTVDLVEEFVEDEKRCCAFFSFTLEEGEDEVVLELAAPSQAGEMLDAAMAAFDPALEHGERLALYRDHAAEGAVDDARG